MKLIAHRGNINGTEGTENHPAYLQRALDAGYDVETDVWYISGKFYTGHGAPFSIVPLSFLRDSRIWCHCKNDAAYQFLKCFPDVNCFVQEDSNSVVNTSRGYPWVGSSAHQCGGGIVYWDGKSKIGNHVAGVYSDHVGKIKVMRSAVSFQLLVVDIDGVLTDSKIYNRDGTVFGKCFCDLDFTAIKRFKSAGIEVCFLSGDTIVNEEMAKSRKIKFFHNTPGEDKVSFIENIERFYKLGRDQMAYVGDDLYDVGIMSQVKFAFCPASSPALVKRVATRVLDVQAGKGVLAALFDEYEDQIPNIYPVDSPDVNPK